MDVMPPPALDGRAEEGVDPEPRRNAQGEGLLVAHQLQGPVGAEERAAGGPEGELANTGGAGVRARDAGDRNDGFAEEVDLMRSPEG